MTAEQLADTMKTEILELVEAGTIPATAASFSELHDHIDANTLGAAEAAYGESGVDVVAPAIEIIDGWIKAGGLNLVMA